MNRIDRRADMAEAARRITKSIQRKHEGLDALAL
jgi:hypothetical protein